MRPYGFTLVEVMVALAVFVAVALALDSTMGANVMGTQRMESKTLATWVASNKLVEMQIYQRWPETGRQDDESEFAGRRWFVQTQVSEGPMPGTREVLISVGTQTTASFEEKLPEATLSALLVQPPQEATP